MKNFLVLKQQEYACEYCDEKVMGGRYNNHCHKCLWSKHVDDKIPGDRASKCQGLMEPIRVIKKNDNFRILHKCVECDKEFAVGVGDKDNQDFVIKLSAAE
jgi:DNA-directed RNA polymerase subunit RPC12/RpoP